MRKPSVKRFGRLVDQAYASVDLAHTYLLEGGLASAALKLREGADFLDQASKLKMQFFSGASAAQSALDVEAAKEKSHAL